MTWWVRIRSNVNDYGRWVPTGCSDFLDARDYIRIYYQPDGHVVEWLQL